MSRTIVIGDIHGALKALRQLLMRINPGKDDTLIFLGDYVDGWSESAQVIDHLIGLQDQHNCIFLKGNHDAWCEAWLGGAMPDTSWLFQGGESTINSYQRINGLQRIRHLYFFNRMKSYHVDEKNRLFIHAGFSSMHGPTLEHYESNFYWDRTLWETALATDPSIKREDKIFPKRLLLFSEIFIGHTPTVNFDSILPMQAQNVWNVDTGAAFTGKLSALDIDKKTIWQSEPVMFLYPDEKGRNK